MNNSSRLLSPSNHAVRPMEHSFPDTFSHVCLNDDEGGLSYGTDVPYEYREAPISHAHSSHVPPSEDCAKDSNLIASGLPHAPEHGI